MEFKEYARFKTKTMHPDDECVVSVSRCGAVKSSSFRVGYERYGVRKYRTYKEKILKQYMRGDYLAVMINQVSTSVHRIVASAFIDNPEGKRTVNHKDGVKTNNNAENLEWATYSENAIHAYDKKLNHHGERNSSSKLTFSQVAEIKARLTNRKRGDLVKIAKDYDVRVSTIKNIAYGKAWKREC